LSWAELSVVVPRGYIEAVSATLFELGAIGLQEDFLPGEQPPVQQPWDTGSPPPLPKRALLRAWWNKDEVGSSHQLIASALFGMEGVGEPVWKDQADDGWADAWRARCVRVEIAAGWAVAPPWLAEPGDLIVEPGMAFGTGEHPTTKFCVGGVVRHAQAGRRCLDVGTGSGVLAIAAARLEMDAWGIDIDPEAARAALENAQLNGVEIRADETPLSEVEGVYDLVVANLFAEVIVALSVDLKRVCSERLIVAGILSDRAHLVIDALEPMQMVHRVVEGGWTHMEFIP
jgi:ribosomal protein L11 methyltransferase